MSTPALDITANKTPFNDALARAEIGQEIVYYRGLYLPADSTAKRAAWSAHEAGLVTLYQRRAKPGFDYIAKRVQS